MKHLRKFETIEEYVSTQLYCPSVSLVDSNVFYENNNDAETPLYIYALADLTVSFSNKTIEYSMDLSTWTSLPAGTATPTIPQGRKVYFRAYLYPSTSYPYGTGEFSATGRYALGGNIMSMLHGENFLDNTTLRDYAFYKLFYGSTNLISAARLVLPATTLTKSCYGAMFMNCRSLVAAPVLPATTLTSGCYSSMFFECLNLKYIKMMATDISASSCLYNWVWKVSSSGTFVKNSAATWDVTGESGVPRGWTVETADA